MQSVIPDSLKIKLSYDWNIPEIFSFIKQSGNIEDTEMKKVFNMGIGMAVIVSPENEENVKTIAEKNIFPLVKIGE